jgi:hypothetical protein
MIELLVAYLLYEGGAGMEWWVLYVAIFLMRIGYLWQQMKREQEEQMVIKKIIMPDEIKRDHSSNH